MTELKERVGALEDKVRTLEEELKTLKQHGAPASNLKVVSTATINVPENILLKVTELDEKEQIPILWFFSDKSIMTVKEFLESCVTKGFTLSHSWLPSAGGYFSATFVKKGIFHEVKVRVKGNEKHWKLTDIARFKIKKKIKELE